MEKRAYRNLMNEGCEGYNPHSNTETIPIDRAEKMNHLLSIMSGTSTEDPRYAELQAEYNDLYEQVWSLEVATARRAAWNAEMMRAKKAGRKVNLVETEKKMGFTMTGLKEAIAHHKL